MKKFLVSKEWVVTRPAADLAGTERPEKYITVRLCAFVYEHMDIGEIYLAIESKDANGEFYGFDDAILTLHEVKNNNESFFSDYFSKYWKFDFDVSEVQEETLRLINWMEEQV